MTKLVFLRNDVNLNSLLHCYGITLGKMSDEFMLRYESNTRSRRNWIGMNLLLTNPDNKLLCRPSGTGLTLWML